jgi:hypothetical protein
MKNAERFEQARRRRIWSETLSPETALERRLVNFIACQDWLLFRSLTRAVASDDPRKMARFERDQCRLADSIGCLIEAVSALQKRRVTPDPPAPATGKVIEMPKRRQGESPAVGRLLEMEPLPRVQPFIRHQQHEPGLRRTLEFHRAA